MQGRDCKVAENFLGKACLVINVIDVSGEGHSLL